MTAQIHSLSDTDAKVKAAAFGVSAIADLPPQFREWPKIARFSRDIVVTEKIDGTNASVCITESGEMYVGSRTRWLTAETDNHGFHKWARENKDELMKLGPGHHFGEWWGSGINRGYGRRNGEKIFSLFNVSRWVDCAPIVQAIAAPERTVCPACCRVVPVLYRGEFDTTVIGNRLDALEKWGSVASPGFMKPEGIVIFHTAASISFKKTIEHDAVPKNSLVPSL